MTSDNMLLHTSDCSLPSSMKHYDYIIAGAGCAGLSLAYHLSLSPLREKSVLLIDQAHKTANDRTWCFWEREKGPFEEIVFRQWQQAYFYGNEFERLLDLGDYRYKMIRGEDFYRFTQAALAKIPAVEWLYGEITDIEEGKNTATVTINGESYSADWVFDSRFKLEALPRKKGYHYLLQHFKGWEIQTEKPVFTPDRATLMDFRIEQHNEARFVYVLPYDEYRALVEFTIFSGNLLSDGQYEQAVADYLDRYLSIQEYQILHKEFGVIPMTDHPLPLARSKRIVFIGTAGGQTKASTGYTFRRIQQHSQAIVQALITFGTPQVSPHAARFDLYDSMLLNLMEKNRYAIREVFTHLFRDNSPGQILKFLDEETSFAEELKIMSTTPSIPFLKALTDVGWQRIG